jgi:ABC-type nitrate/sulfonate/bicarbonate transport system substrate-binding protein
VKAPRALAKLSLLLLIGAVVQPLWAQETRRVRFAVTNPPHFLPIWLARDTGIFSKHGLDVEIIFMRGGALITMGILSGELQLSGVGAESVVAAKLEGGDAVLLACPLDTDLVYLIGRPDIKTPEQLKGKSTAVTRLGSSIHFYLRSALKYLGMDADKEMTILQLGGGPEIAAALETGRIAAGILTIRYALPFLERGWPVLIDLSKTDLKYPPSCVGSSRAFVRRNPNTVERFLKAYTEAIHVIKTDSALAKRVYAKEYRESDAAVVDKIVTVYSGLFKSIPSVPASGLETVIREAAARKPLPSEDFRQPDFYKDDAPLQKIVKEGWIEQLGKR